MLEKLVGAKNYFKLTRKEYDASINALNLFFGAVIGVSLGSIDEIATREYVILLISTATVVTTILFVSYSDRRHWSILLMLVALVVLWWIGASKDNLLVLPSKLMPTLGVWASMAIVTEFTDIVPEEDKKA